jgi:5-methyltetrahydropteroyltriglutamate--homocysteine methyltransferase
MANSPTFRTDHVGSLLRPEALLEARRRRYAETIEAGELRALEYEAIAAAVAGQREAGIDIITDGEFRRRDFRTGLVGRGGRHVDGDLRHALAHQRGRHQAGQ